MRVGLVYTSLISNVCLSRLVSCSQAYFVPGLRRLASKRVPNLAFQIQGDPLTRGSAREPRWGSAPRPPL